MFRTQDFHVKEIVPLLSPRAMKALAPTPEAVTATVAQARDRVIRILNQEDPRLLVVIGPCSIHDEKSALEYATRLSKLQKEFANKLEIVMRVYFEKPRTTIGWKGLINDPHLDGSQDIEAGLKIARKLLLEIGCMGLRRKDRHDAEHGKTYRRGDVLTPEHEPSRCTASAFDGAILPTY